jgi:hypothetical protein
VFCLSTKSMLSSAIARSNYFCDCYLAVIPAKAGIQTLSFLYGAA